MYGLIIGLIQCHYRVITQRVILYCQHIFDLVLLEYDQPLLEKRPTLQETFVATSDTFKVNGFITKFSVSAKIFIIAYYS